jgi:hypothetical protein
MTFVAPPYVVVPAIPPRPPQLSLLNSAVRPDNVTDPASPGPALDLLSHLPDELRAELAGRKGEPWIRGFTYAPENHYAIENRDPQDFTSVDAPAIPAPSGLALLQGTGGTLANGTYAYQVTAVNPNGETTALAPTTIVVAAGGGTATVKLTWKPVADDCTYKVYGRISGSIGLLATVGPFDVPNPPAYTDPGSPAPGAAPPVSNTTGGVGPYTNVPSVQVFPWLIVANDFCSSFGFETRDFKGRALRLLENGQHQAIEREFWTGAQAKGYPINYLTNPASYSDLTPGTPPSVARGLQILQDALQTCGFGGQGMIHVQAQTAPNLLSVRRVGSLLLDVFDNIVVPGSGYPGTAAGIGTVAAGTAVMFATDLVMCRAEEQGQVYPDSFAEALDRGQAGFPNRIDFRAEKYGCAYFDAACHFGCRVTLAT